MSVPDAPMESKAKSLSPPDAVSCCLVDHANGRLLTGLLEQVVGQKEDKLVEKVVHTLSVHCRLHGQAITEGVLPLVLKLGQGKKLGESVTAKALAVEEALAAVDKSKKHVGDEGFAEACAALKKATTELMEELEATVLPALVEELDVAELVAAAETMEQAKLSAPLAPQLTAA